MQRGMADQPSLERLRTERRKSMAQRLIGNVHESGERLTQLEDQKNCAGSRERKNEQGTENDDVRLSEQTETGKDDREPKNQHRQEGHGYGIVCLREQKQTRFCKFGAGLNGPVFQRTLRIVRWREVLEFLKKCF